MEMSDAKILIADDGRVMRLVLSNRLKDEGYEILQAENGREAVNLIEAHGDIDLVVLDVNMPEMSGIEALKKIRETLSQTRLPIIMATANDEDEDVVRAFELGANDFVSKPINFPVLMARVITQLKLKRAMEELERLANRD